jgi:hypothetical protein
MQSPTVSASLDGVAVEPMRLTEVAGRATGRDGAEVASVETRPAAHRVENITTAALTHVSGTLTDGTPWRVFAKTLQPAWCSPMWKDIPPAFHEQVKRTLDWHDEPRIYRGPLADDLPAGLRLPRLYGLDETEERITLWLEEVDDAGPWDTARYERSARRLGRLAGRWPEARAVERLGVRRHPLPQLFHSKVTHADIPALAEDTVWETTAMRAACGRHGDLRADLDRLAEVAPGLAAVSEELPHALAHGDAAPANLHEPGSGEIVAIDLGMVQNAAVGSDLGQLFVGRFDAGLATEAELHAIAAVLLPAFCAGLADEGQHVDPQLVKAGWAISMAVRSVFSLPIVHRPDLDEAARGELLARRAAACRFGIDLALEVADRIA